MGATASKPVREAPVRYVAKKMPRLDKTPVEQQFKKPSFTAQGINTRTDDVNTEPLMYVETSKDASSTELTDHSAPRWYLNTYMEMMDNMRTDKSVVSGNLPTSWFRDNYEPYSLVRGRIDDEDLRWVLAPEQRNMAIDELTPHTKLDHRVLQDILDTVELPRTQYRNYKGKLHKSIEDANTHMTTRKVQVEKAREAEVLRRIGYTEEEIAKDEQYLTNRPRGLKVLDELGASLREKKRQHRAAEVSELEDMLEDRRIEQIERGEVELTEADLHERPEHLAVKPRFIMNERSKPYRRMYAADIGKDEVNQQKFQWWLDRTRRIKRAVDTIHGVPVYNERLSANEEQTRKQMREAAEFNFHLSQAQGAKGFIDPRGHRDQLMGMLRYNKEESHADTSVDVHEDGAADHTIFRFPYTKDHAAKPKQWHPTDRRDHPERVDTDINVLYGRQENNRTDSTAGDSGNLATEQKPPPKDTNSDDTRR